MYSFALFKYLQPVPAVYKVLLIVTTTFGMSGVAPGLQRSTWNTTEEFLHTRRHSTVLDKQYYIDTLISFTKSLTLGKKQ